MIRINNLPDDLISEIIAIAQSDSDISWAYGRAILRIYHLAGGRESLRREMARGPRMEPRFS